MTFTYSSIIVTYNRKDKLIKSIQSLLNQKYIQPRKIIIIDNKSTDGTKKMLEEKGLLNNQVIDYNQMDKNYGGSGGFYYGVKRALEICNDEEYVSFSDDDAYFNSNFFKTISNALKSYPNCKAFCGTVQYDDGKIQTDHRRRIVNKKWIKEQEFSVEDYKKDFFVDTFSFVGSVVKMEILKKIGLPKKEYFIYYDDTEYSLRVNKQTKILNVSNAKVTHDITKKKSTNIVTWKNYYELRNSMLMKKKHSNWKWLTLYFYYRQIHLYWFIITNKAFKGQRKKAFITYSHAFRDAQKGVTGKVKPFVP